MRYKTKGRKNKTKICLFIILAIVVLINIIGGTNAKYNGNSSGTGTVQVAKWNININGENILANQNTISDELEINIDTSPMDGIIRNGDTGYFDILINPTGTEVSVDYEINLSFLQSNELSTDMKFTEYSFNSGAEKTEIEDNTINGTINLSNLAPVTCRVYWKWNGNVSINNSEEYEINANVKVKQKIS